MDGTTYGFFLATSLLIGAAPGPTTLLVLSHALGRDPWRPAALIAGAFCGNVVLVLVTVLGLSALIVASQTAFELLRWLGAGYLIYLGWRHWRAPALPVTAPGAARATAYGALALQAAMTSMTNPKGLVFYLAFLPQFVTPGAGAGWQLGLLGASYVGVFVAVLAGYALAGRRLAYLFVTPRAMRLKNRLTGTFLIGAGLSLLRYERA